MAKDGKFGTFGGVFTPSILTILGVIMYLRLPWVVGNGGLYVALGIIGVSHVISISTGLSISSIATDKKVGAGGPYYIVSRSLGLPIGGTLGLALFTGLAFSVSLYVIGFSESFLGYVGIERTPTAIRICGSITLVVLTAITLISTELAIKTQYVILALIAASIASILLGSPEAAVSQPHMSARADSPSLALLFGIFFPAVTGFTAGVNMSGDLRNPKSSIPRGTMLAIAVGLVVYIGLAAFLAYRVPAKQLVEDKDVLINIAWFGPAVVAGIWGATLSSAIGSIMGAPRILQALSTDAITPRWFGRGYGKTNEPRNALVLAFIIAEGGILIAELDAIARIVSMVFLTTYGFLNFSAAIESWASPDFRPSFRIPKAVSIVGAITAVLVMIQLDLFAMAGATAIMAGLFFYLQRKQLELEAGDAWAGIWSSLIRSGLARLSGETQQKRNWRPIILLFRSPDSPATPQLRNVARSLVSENGIVTDFELVAPGTPPPEDKPEDETRLGVFGKRLPCEDRYEAVENICRYHGFAALQPNTVLLPWTAHRHDPARFCQLLDSASELDFNLLLFATGPDSGAGKRIDVWWRADGGNLGFSIALLRFITREARWERAEVRLLLLSPDTSANDHLRSSARHQLTEARLEATIRVLNDRLKNESFEERVAEESKDADLTLVGLPHERGEVTAEYQTRVDRLAETLGGILLIRASSTFDESVHVAREAAVSFLPPVGEDGVAELPELELPATPDLAREVTDFADGMQHLVTRFYEDCIQRIHARHVELTRRIIASVERYFAALEKAVEASNLRRVKTASNRALSTLFLECQQALEEFESQHLDEQSGILSERIAAFLADDRVVIRRRNPEELLVHRGAEDFEPRANDSDYVRSFKLRRRTAARFSRGKDVRYRIQNALLRDFYFQEVTRDGLRKSVGELETDTHQMVIAVGKVLDSIGEVPDTGEGETAQEAVREHQGQVVARLHDLVQHSKQRVNQQQWSLLVKARELSIRFAADIDRLDVRRLIKKERRVTKDAVRLATALGEIPDRWKDNQARLVQLAGLALKLSSFQHRLKAMANRERDQVALDVRNGVLSQCQALAAALEEFRNGLSDETSVPQFSVHLELDGRFEPKPIIDVMLREGAELAAELPETVTTVNEESMQALEEGRGEAAEMTELPVRRLVQFLIESRFVGGLSEDLDRIPKTEQRAAGVAQDVVRLISFQLSELEAAEGSEKKVLREQLVEVIDNGLERTRAEAERLAELLPEVVTAFDERLVPVMDGTNAYDLGATSANLEQHIRLHQGRAAVSGVRGLIRRGVLAGRHALVNLVYRKSEGVLLARQLKAEASHGGALVDRVAALVEANTPRPEVIDALPFYYRQLFFGQAAVSDAFWIGRDEQLARARRAVAAFRRGSSGALLVVGARGAGKTALAQRVLADADCGEVVRVHPRPGGSVEQRAFDVALAKAADRRGTADEVLQALPEGSAVLLDDLELWWERSENGIALIDHILGLMERHGGRLLFVVCMGDQTLTLLDRLRSLSDRALVVLRCAPLPTESLKQLVTVRHASTGAKYSFDAQQEDELGELKLARLFSDYFDYSGGVVGAALRAWITHIDKVSGDALSVRAPRVERWEVLDELKSEWTALLLELVLHKQISPRRLARVTGMNSEDLARELDTLRRAGLVVESRQRVLEINPFVHHIIASRLERLGLMA